MDSEQLLDGRFRLVERIGAGGMGVVFHAVDERDRRPVAVKLLEGRSAQEIERSRREAAVLARLSHPAIVRHIADGVLPDGRLFLAMEWIEGVTVAHRIANGGLTLRESVAIARRIADALASAHRVGIVHRDLKPSNILLSRGEPEGATLIDFGVARMHDSVLALTRTGAAIGTPGYMSPEQARGERDLTPAADVFGLGCVLYECATASPAFSGTAAAAVMAKILLAEPLPLASRCPEVPPALVALVERMLAKAVPARFPDCGAVVTAIDALAPIPQGPRRSSRRLTLEATQVARDPGAAHCMIAASNGSADDMLEPPTPDQQEQLEQAASAWQARLEILATGAVVIHVTGDKKAASHRAALLALAMRRILPGWSIAISSVHPDVNVAADEGTALLTSAALEAIFGTGPSGAISIDPSTAELLGEEFQISSEGGRPALLGTVTGD